MASAESHKRSNNICAWCHHCMSKKTSYMSCNICKKKYCRTCMSNDNIHLTDSGCPVCLDHTEFKSKNRNCTKNPPFRKITGQSKARVIYPDSPEFFKLGYPSYGIKFDDDLAVHYAYFLSHMERSGPEHFTQVMVAIPIFYNIEY